MSFKFKHLFEADKLSDHSRQLAKTTFRYGGIWALITSILILGLVVYFFFIAPNDYFPWYVGVILIILAVARLLVSTISFRKMAAFDIPDPHVVEGGGAGKLAVSVQRIGEGRARYKLYRALEVSILLIGLGILIYFLGLPWVLGAFMILVALFMPVLQVIELKRIASVDVRRPDGGEEERVEIGDGEILLESLPGIMRYGWKSGGHEIMGKGKSIAPENALLITNKAIWVLTVPLPGSGQVVAGTNISVWQWQTAYQDIRQGLEYLVSSRTLEELLHRNRGKRLMRWEEIKHVEAKPHRMTLLLVREDGEKFGYVFRQIEDFEKAKRALRIS